MFTFDTRALELEELELALNRDARLDAELTDVLTDLEELSLLLLLLLLLRSLVTGAAASFALLLMRDEELEEDLELRLERELLE